VRYCLNLPIGGEAAGPRTLAGFAAAAEEAGWDAVFVEDYIVYQNHQDWPAYDPWVALAAMATATSRIRLGTMVTPLARRRPWKLARETVTLDHLSGGRLTLCAGSGDPADVTYAAFGEETRTSSRAGLLDEALDVLTGLWSGQPFHYDGQHFRVTEVTLLPGPSSSRGSRSGSAAPSPTRGRCAGRPAGTGRACTPRPPGRVLARTAGIRSRPGTSPRSAASSSRAAGARARSTSWPGARSVARIRAAPGSSSASARRPAPRGSANGSRPATPPPCAPASPADRSGSKPAEPGD
jgi:alkanesulfonate monooxygenase SsuD/methylene tetrahydromethanopterin reductase-like flavin-dependent oxidoreductase (luciferase family)